jgi:NADPH:quinone reductase-like Zn-dependent oxidoreductase
MLQESDFYFRKGTSMKAIVYTTYGPPDVLQLKDVEKPAPKDDEVLVKIHAASINYGDSILVRGKPIIGRLWSGLTKPKYAILGTDIAGRVEAAGRDAKQFQAGDEVFGDIGANGFGAFAEYVSVRESALALKPVNVTFEQAAAAPQAAVVALQGLRDSGQIQAGQEVLINGASGGIGSFAVQIAKSFGTRVTGVCSTRNLELVRSIGADEVIDYTQEDFTKSGKHYDLIFDIVANRSVSDYLLALKPAGNYVACAFNPTSLFLGPLVSKKSGRKVISLSHKPNQDDLLYIKELFEDRKIDPVIERSFRLSEVAEALRYVEEGQQRGKVVITVEQENN